jgi:hypothetical protein
VSDQANYEGRRFKEEIEVGISARVQKALVKLKEEYEKKEQLV